jgi:D-glycero-D-manno-heptose 1,7-bisphosphate phosphatase
MNKAVFLDKDGTLIKDVPYNVNPAKIELESYATQALSMLKTSGFKLIVISNQAGVAHGYFKEDSLEIVWDTIQQLLRPQNVSIDAFYFCPHHPEAVDEKYAARCLCRKPEPGLILRAAVDFNIDLSLSWMIGDILHDVEAGNKAGCNTILLDNGHETEWVTDEKRLPGYIVKNLKEAVTIILQHKTDVNGSKLLQHY